MSAPQFPRSVPFTPKPLSPSTLYTMDSPDVPRHPYSDTRRLRRAALSDSSSMLYACLHTIVVCGSVHSPKAHAKQPCCSVLAASCTEKKIWLAEQKRRIEPLCQWGVTCCTGHPPGVAHRGEQPHQHSSQRSSACRVPQRRLCKRCRASFWHLLWCLEHL